MTDIKKEQEREELHRAIWAIADELRGAVDGWDFKNYVLGTMFYRFISEDLTNYINQNEIEAGDTDFDYAKMSDEDAEEAAMLARYGGGNLAALSAEPNRLFGHAHVVEDMIAAVRDGRDPEVMPAEALKSVRIVHAVYESARTGKTVML